jgi:hypothetical protein
VQSKLLRELSPECTPRNTFGHRHESYRLSLRKIRNVVNTAIINSFFVLEFWNNDILRDPQSMT